MSALRDHDGAARSITAVVEPILPACPTWCVQEHDDLLLGDDVQGGAVATFHRSTRAVLDGQECETVGVYMQRYDVVSVDGTVEESSVVVAMDYTGAAGFSPDQARRLADWLTTAADQIDRSQPVDESEPSSDPPTWPDRPTAAATSEVTA